MAKILIIDDEAMIRYLIRRILEESEHHLVDVDNGRAGLELTRIEKFDVIITDIVMPVMEGFELVSTLKRENPEQRIIVISGGTSLNSNNSLDSDDGLEVEGRLNKPFTPSQLIELVDTVLTP